MCGVVKRYFVFYCCVVVVIVTPVVVVSCFHLVFDVELAFDLLERDARIEGLEGRKKGREKV